MAKVALIVNISDMEHEVRLGLSGTFIITPKPPASDFSMMIVYPCNEGQDIGDNRKIVNTVKALRIAENIVGMSKDGQRQTELDLTVRGVLLCAAEPDIPVELEAALEAEATFLNDHPVISRYKKDKASGALVVVPIYEGGEKEVEKREQLSAMVVRERSKFESECRKLMTRPELDKTRKRYLQDCAKNVAEGDQIWAGPPNGHRNISDKHRHDCRVMGQERPWCYVPQELVDCPGCGSKMKVGIFMCPNCNALFDRPLEDYKKMPPGEAVKRLYPNRISGVEVRV